ncbi:hypothetical protein AKJ16_DCAP16304 [Drosera capensis]
MAITSTRLFSCSFAAAPSPPKPHTTTSPSHLSTRDRPPQHELEVRRREIPLLLSLGGLIPNIGRPAPAFAFEFGISGPKDWLKEQKKKSIKFILAPIDASPGKDAEYGDKELEEVRRLVKTAARDCVVNERNSFVSFQAKTGVEICTFSLVVNNASSLLDDGDPLKLEAEAKLDDLVKSFTLLNSMANNVNIQVLSSREKLAEAVTRTTFFLNKFEEVGGIWSLIAKELAASVSHGYLPQVAEVDNFKQGRGTLRSGITFPMCQGNW